MQQLLDGHVKVLVLRRQQCSVQDPVQIGLVRVDDVVQALRGVYGAHQTEPGSLQHLEHQEGAEVVDHVHHHRAVEVAAVEDQAQVGRDVRAVAVVKHGVLLPGGGQRPLHSLQPPEHVEGDAVLRQAVHVNHLQYMCCSSE